MIRFVNTIEQIGEVRAFLSSQREVGFDTETDGKTPFDGRLLAAQIGNYDTQFVIDTQTIMKMPDGIEILVSVLSMLKDTIVLGHNLKYDIGWMLPLGVDFKNLYDTFIGECILTTGFEKTERGLSLKACCQKYLQVNLKKEIRGKIIYSGFTEDVIQYCAEDVKYLQIIKRLQLQELAKWYPNNILIDEEMKFVRTLALMEYNGLLLDTDKWNDVYKITSEERAKIELKLDNIVANDPKLTKYANNAPQLELLFDELPSREIKVSKVKWSSPKQKGEILKELGIVVKSTDKKYLLKTIDKHPIIPVLIKYSEHNKLASTYGKKFLKFINPVTKKIHTNFFQIIKSGRVSTSAPNLLNIPRKGDLGKVIRACFIARPGYKLMATDFSNFELRIIAEYANEQSWTETFLSDGDLHTILCMKTFNIPIEDIKKRFPYNPEITYREVQKTVDFGLSYGMSEFKLSETIGVSIPKARAIIADFFNIVPNVKKILNTWAYAAVSRGYIRTPEPYRRVRWFPEYNKLQKLIESQNPDSLNDSFAIKKIKGAIERPAKNQIPQGTNGDIIKNALNSLQDIIDENHYPVEIKLSIYDEILDEVRDDFVETWKPIKEQIMIEAAQRVIHTIPIKVETKINTYWEK